MMMVPDLFMSANTCGEKLMTQLFIAGLNNGVRGFDTAREYGTEKKVGKALKVALAETGLRREDIFVQSRISNEEIIKGHIENEVKRSVDSVGLGYLDSFMFHWPTPDHYIPAWRRLTSFAVTHKDMIRSTGMCNCRMRHMLAMERECDIMPDILQIEVTPLWQAKDLVQYCNDKGIVVEAFSPLAKMVPPIRENAVLQALADKYGVSIPQIILRWNNQRAVRPISLTTKLERVKSNFDIFGFTLSDDDMARISDLDCGYKLHLESATCAGF